MTAAMTEHGWLACSNLMCGLRTEKSWGSSSEQQSMVGTTTGPAMPPQSLYTGEPGKLEVMRPSLYVSRPAGNPDGTGRRSACGSRLLFSRSHGRPCTRFAHIRQPAGPSITQDFWTRPTLNETVFYEVQADNSTRMRPEDQVNSLWAIGNK